MGKISERDASPQNPFVIRYPKAIEGIDCSAIRVIVDPVGGTGLIESVARIVVGVTIAAAVVVAEAAAGMIMEYVLTIVVGVTAGATTD